MVSLILASRLSALEVSHNSCNMGTHSLPEMYYHSPRVQFRQSDHAHVTTTYKMYARMYMHTFVRT